MVVAVRLRWVDLPTAVIDLFWLICLRWPYVYLLLTTRLFADGYGWFTFTLLHLPGRWILDYVTIHLPHTFGR